MMTIYPRRFFEISIRFAQKVSQLSGITLDAAMLTHTNCYIRFGLGHDLNPANPLWKAYAQGLVSAEDPIEWTYRFYLLRAQNSSPVEADSPFGCFSYTMLTGGRVRLHFHNALPLGQSPLVASRLSARRKELKTMFTYIRQEEDLPTTVIGASWLYNLEAYRSLFPPAFIATAQEMSGQFAYLPLWGQFLDKRMQVKEDLAGPFLECIKQKRSLETLESCFPFKVLYLETSIQEFYPFYKIKD
ncbi:MAG TPA: hypothetical protein PKW33_21840 [Anaerolineaceae bacterium]|nr:hypothetical protein [Anaerolineaceae bacterium]HPN54252.1 hypothetical protein [Anaerolineaceae bacterium]